MLLGNDFMLTNAAARELFHETAKNLPIVDYHCHLDPQEIYEDANFSGIVDAWLGGDHYKWRLMRANGVPESLITGSGSDWEKFQAYAATMEKALGNPVYLWSNLELQRLFGITEPLGSGNARKVFDQANEMLASAEYSRRNILKLFNVEVVCTTDDVRDDLSVHKKLEDQSEVTVLPTFRPDGVFQINSPKYAEWINGLESSSGKCIDTFADLIDALASRADFFASMGCRVSDHGLDPVLFAEPGDVDRLMNRAREGQWLNPQEVASYRTAVMLELLAIYERRDWTAQLHCNALREINTKAVEKLGTAAGFDAIDDSSISRNLTALVNRANMNHCLPRSIFYSLNPSDWRPLATIMGAFQQRSRQWIQLGAPWWFNDHRNGIREQLQIMAEQSLLGNFVGMTTDSRSFLSYARHEYFRRILCDLVGEWAERGEIPDDPQILSRFVTDISYTNAREMVLGTPGATIQTEGF